MVEATALGAVQCGFESRHSHEGLLGVWFSDASTVWPYTPAMCVS